jgi:predicted ATPase
MKIAKLTQAKIFKILLKEFERIQSNNEGHAINILEQVFNLKELPSEDSRYENALGDVVQHYFRNNDWSTDHLLLSRFNVNQNDDVFRSFIEAILLPENFKSNEEISEVSGEIDQLLRKEDLKLVTDDFNDLGFPIQKIQNKDEANDLPAGVKRNDIPFYVQKNETPVVSSDEHFVLLPYTSWNDYGVISIFTLVYHDKNGESLQIGSLKIIHDTADVTLTEMEDRFFHLSDKFCSLSGTPEYYFSLQRNFNENGMISILYALQDAAYFSDIGDEWESKTNFKHSLIRENSAERMLRELKPVLKGHDLTSIHSFSYRFQPAFADAPIKVDFHFDNSNPLANRIFAIIGKNGTGKTQLLNALPNSLAHNSVRDFYGKVPLFTKIIAVSYSVFDTFKIPKKNATFNYVYCGLKDQDGDMRSNKGLTISFHNNWKKIDDMRRTRRWRDILVNVIEEEIVNQFILDSEDYDRDLEVSIQGFHSIKDKLSSGQSILLYIITQVIANIRLDSLIIYDEPETHLHPNAIVELMNSIYELVNEFESYCLIGTHSPLVIRELLSKNVYVMQRDGNVPSLRRIGIESFGENLGVLNDEVFGDRQVPKQYKKIIEDFISIGYTFDQMVKLLQSDEVPLSLNARIYIANLIKRKDEEL